MIYILNNISASMFRNRQSIRCHRLNRITFFQGKSKFQIIPCFYLICSNYIGRQIFLYFLVFYKYRISNIVCFNCSFIIQYYILTVINLDTCQFIISRCHINFFCNRILPNSLYKSIIYFRIYI